QKRGERLLRVWVGGGYPNRGGGLQGSVGDGQYCRPVCDRHDVSCCVNRGNRRIGRRERQIRGREWYAVLVGEIADDRQINPLSSWESNCRWWKIEFHQRRATHIKSDRCPPGGAIAVARLHVRFPRPDVTRCRRKGQR